ncbi:transporter substrate-binding domain-containing protein [Desulfobacterales bacterium HSG16]|nr:transporter substrate-binding domain-containing protein [Desulfobacterales bacterium HSG16]
MMKLKRFGIFVVVSLLTVLFSFPLHAENKLLKGGIWEFPPYQYEDKSGKIVGYFADLFAASCEEIGISVNLKMASYARCQENTKKGKYDFYISGGKTNARQEWGYFPSDGFMFQAWSLVILKKNVGKIQYTKLEDLKGLKIGIIRGVYYGKKIMEYTKMHSTIEAVSKDIYNYKKLNAGRIDALYAEINVSKYMTKKIGMQETVFLADRVFVFANMYPVFSKKTVKPELVEKFSEALKKVKASKYHDDLLKKYNVTILDQPIERAEEYME